MAAIFYNPVEGNTVFKSGVHINTTVRVPFLDNLVSEFGFAIINDVTVQNNDIIQYFVTFDDLISYFYFGKGLGTISINGSIFIDCSGYASGVDTFYDLIAAQRGSEVVISFGNAAFTGVIQSYTTSAKSEPENSIDFSIQLSIIDHSLTRPNFNSRC